MNRINPAKIWRQQKFNNSCAWDCLAMLLGAMGVETSTINLVATSGVPFQIRFHPDDKHLSAGMLVQDDKSFNTAILSLGFRFSSEKVSGIQEYIENAQRILADGNSFITSIKRPNSPGRHAVVITETCDSYFYGLDPDCGLNREEEYKYHQVEDKVTLKLSEADLIRAVKGYNDYRPILGHLSSCESDDSENDMYRTLVENSANALKFYEKETRDLDFAKPSTISVINSILKPIALDLRIAIEIRDRYLHQESEIALFLKSFERDLLLVRKQLIDREKVSTELKSRLHDSVIDSLVLLKKHILNASFDQKRM